LEIKDNNIYIEGVDFAEINIDNLVISDNNVIIQKEEIKDIKKQIILGLPRDSKFDDVFNVFKEYGFLDIKISKGSFDNCEGVIITYDNDKDYYTVKKALENKQIRLKNNMLPYYKNP
jgi:hypothetical protein